MLEARSRTKSDAEPLYVRQQSQYNTGRCIEKHVSSSRMAPAERCSSSSSSSTAGAAVGGSARGGESGEVLGGELGPSASASRGALVTSL